jgi:hypothetical protein
MCIFCCGCISLDQFCLFFLTVALLLVIYIDLSVLKTMLEEFILLRSYLDDDTYYNCYKLQAQMRISIELIVIYALGVAAFLAAMAMMHLDRYWMCFFLGKVQSVSYIMLGPLMLAFSMYGIFHGKQISNVCSIRGITGHFNAVCVFVVVAMFCVSVVVTYLLMMQKTTDLAIQTMTAENSVMYHISHAYGRYLDSLRRNRERRRREAREERRQEQEAAEARRQLQRQLEEARERVRQRILEE